MTPEQLYSENEALCSFAIEKLFGSHRSAALVANKRYMEYDDLLQIAREALWWVCNRFDESRGLKFSTFAVHVIMQRIKKHTMYKGHLVHIPRDGRKPERAELMKKGIETSYFSDPIHTAEGRTIEDLMSARDNVAESIKWLYLEQLLATLTERERKIITMALLSKTQREIGEEIGVSQVHVSRTMKKALKKLNPNYEQFYKAN